MSGIRVYSILLLGGCLLLHSGCSTEPSAPKEAQDKAAVSQAAAPSNSTANQPVAEVSQKAAVAAASEKTKPRLPAQQAPNGAPKDGQVPAAPPTVAANSPNEIPAPDSRGTWKYQEHKDFNGVKLAVIHTANVMGEVDPCG